MKPIVSICTITYNQENFIAQAIESVLMQKTNFKIEMVIAEDCSTDSTRAIVEDYVKRYPEIIKPIYQEKNIGAAKNSVACLDACSGEYIAMLEGDDYWIDPLKLQKQVDFLGNNLDYAICFNRVYEQLGDKKCIAPVNPWQQDMTFSILDLSLGNFMHTNSVIFRSAYLKDLPIWFEDSPIGDYVINMFNAKNGLIKYFHQIMGVYRLSTGIWSSQVKSSQIKKVIHLLNLLEKEKFDIKVKDQLAIHKQNLFDEYFSIMLTANDFSYLDMMQDFIENESDFIKKWMLIRYPEKINNIVNSKSYKFATLLSDLKNKFIQW